MWSKLVRQKIVFLILFITCNSSTQEIRRYFNDFQIDDDLETISVVYGQERHAPEFLSPVPIRKTRAGLQFTCAAPTLPPKGQPPDVWVRTIKFFIPRYTLVIPYLMITIRSIRLMILQRFTIIKIDQYLSYYI